MSSEVAALRPGYVPDGFSLWGTSDGSTWGGLNDEPDQLRLSYATKVDEDQQLMVAIAAGSSGEFPVLFATEEQQGVKVDLGLAAAVAVYHDGMWGPGPGFDQRDTGAGLVHWDRTGFHSVTADLGGVICAVRASRASGLELTDLIQIAKSVPSDPQGLH